jgi:hypothetical protein
MFLQYYKSAFFSPYKTFVELVCDSRKLRYAFLAVAIQAALYTFVYVFLIFGGGQPYKPWLDIPLEEYYRYNVFFCAPSMFLGWILATGVVHLLSRLYTANGSFEQVLALMGFGISIASWSTGLHDFITSFLGAVHIIEQQEYELMLNSATIWRTLLWIQMIIYLLWFIFLFSAGVKATFKLTNLKCFLLGFSGFVIYQGFFLIFNR